MRPTNGSGRADQRERLRSSNVVGPLTVSIGLSLRNVARPMPFTRNSCSTFANCVSFARNAKIACARAGPTRGKRSSSAAVAVLRLTTPFASIAASARALADVPPMYRSAAHPSAYMSCVSLRVVLCMDDPLLKLPHVGAVAARVPSTPRHHSAVDRPLINLSPDARQKNAGTRHAFLVSTFRPWQPVRL
jgi:hypothetical protein